MTDGMLFLLLDAPFIWLMVCTSYFAITTAEPTRTRMSILFGPPILMILTPLIYSLL